MAVFVCDKCEKRWVEDTLPRRGSICFGCHLKGIRIGYTHGKKDFHGPTIKERQDKIVSDAAAKGITAVPAKDYGF
jgi:cytochrome c5